KGSNSTLTFVCFVICCPHTDVAALGSLCKNGYLSRFYNLSPSGGVRRRVRSTSAMEEKIREMQHFFGLKETGRLDRNTLDVMREPRCGFPDIENFSFYPGKPKWKNHTITYMIAKYTPDMKREDVEKSFSSAIKMWSDESPLRFIKVNHGKADIVFSFAVGTHGDFFPFDGPRGVLAHAFQPGEGMGGDVHFDEDETWTAGNLFAVAAHELGHSLGLTHSQDRSAIMYPNYRYQSNTQYSLSKDDALGIQALYGKPTRQEETQAAPQKLPKYWLDFQSENTTLHLNYSPVQLKCCSSCKRLTELGCACGMSQNAVTWLCVFFPGHKYWVVQRLKMKSQAGSIYEYGFSSRVRQVDAAVHITEYGKTVFFIGEVYYRFDERKRIMDPGFPRLIQTDWPGIPRRVDAAFKLQGNKYRKTSYQYDFRKKQVVNVISANSWLGC
uniref:Matrix metalloproteinase-20-like n=1 Tax=Labrus bergylta TaxID=56723 RepID=A0A3Q3FXA7_9LABR